MILRHLAPAVFRATCIEPAPVVPPWWPNDKQLVLDFRPAPPAVHDDEED